MVEKPATRVDRAAQVREILTGPGVPATAIKVRLMEEASTPEGSSDLWSRRVPLVKRDE